MTTLFARFMLAVALLLGNVAVPAIAAVEPGGHCFELSDDDCASLQNSQGDRNDQDGMPVHVDHHHCSACIVLDEMPAAPASAVARNDLTLSPHAKMASRATAPPTQPPSA